MADKYRIKVEFVFVQPNQEQLTKIAQLIDTNELKVDVDSVYRLDEFALAHKKSKADHTRGKIVIQVSSD